MEPDGTKISSGETGEIEDGSLSPDIDYKTLESLFPQVEAMSGYDQKSARHHLALDEHTREVDRLLSQDPYSQNLSDRERMLLSLAAKLHDIGKPNTAAENPKKPGFNSYIGHEKVGAEMSEAILRKFNLTDDERKWILDIIRLHAASLNIGNAFTQNEQPRGKQLGAYDRFISEIEAMPGSQTPEGLQRNLEIMMVFTASDIRALADDRVRQERPEVGQSIDEQIHVIDILRCAFPAILQAVNAKRSGVQTAGIVKENGVYSYSS